VRLQEGRKLHEEVSSARKDAEQVVFRSPSGKVRKRSSTNQSALENKVLSTT